MIKFPNVLVVLLYLLASLLFSLEPLLSIVRVSFFENSCLFLFCLKGCCPRLHATSTARACDGLRFRQSVSLYSRNCLLLSKKGSTGFTVRLVTHYHCHTDGCILQDDIYVYCSDRLHGETIPYGGDH